MAFRFWSVPAIIWTRVRRLGLHGGGAASPSSSRSADSDPSSSTSHLTATLASTTKRIR